MRPVRCSDVVGVGGEGVYLPGGVPAQGVYLPGGVYPSMYWGRHPSLQTEWQTGVKTLPCRNEVADGNNL